jgi:hypothetical protein
MTLQPSVTKLTIIATLLVAGADIDMKVILFCYHVPYSHTLVLQTAALSLLFSRF